MPYLEIFSKSKFFSFWNIRYWNIYLPIFLHLSLNSNVLDSLRLPASNINRYFTLKAWLEKPEFLSGKPKLVGSIWCNVVKCGFMWLSVVLCEFYPFFAYIHIKKNEDFQVNEDLV